MARPKLIIVSAATVFVTMIGIAHAGMRPVHGGGGGGGGHGGHHHLNGGTLGGFGGIGLFYGGFGVGIPIIYPPIFVVGPGMFVAGMPMGMPSGPLMPLPPPGMLSPPPARAAVGANAGMDGLRGGHVKAADPSRAAQLVVVGDRLVRAGNLKKAEERYLQAMRAAPDLAAPRVRLAIVAAMRSNYTEAAGRLREAETAEPGWIINAQDIQAIFGEPTDFTRQLARIESHVNTHPEDRDAWLMLGAEWFLSGRTARAADVFKRLKDPDRKSDLALSAFLEASNQEEARRRERDR
jgi:hypothetical protein